MLDYGMTWSGAPGAVGYDRGNVSADWTVDTAGLSGRWSGWEWSGDVAGSCAGLPAEDNCPGLCSASLFGRGLSRAYNRITIFAAPPNPRARIGFPSYLNQACLTRREKIGGIQCEG